MRIINLNPATDIGASAWFVDLEGHRLLRDAGTPPKREGRESLPQYNLIRKEELDAIAVTHCHHDHVGSLPVALRHFPKAHALMTALSSFLIERLLHNSANAMNSVFASIRSFPTTKWMISPRCFRGSATTAKSSGQPTTRRGPVFLLPHLNSSTPATPSARRGSWPAAQRKNCFT